MAPARVLLNSVRYFAPQLYSSIVKMDIRAGKVAPEKLFHMLPNISFDYAILERLKKAYLIRSSFDWCDVGTWKTFEDIWPRDRFQNSVSGAHLAVNSHQNIIYSRDKMVCLQGVNDLVVVDTPDALLVSAKDSEEGMREIIRSLSKNKKTASKYL